MHYYIQKGFSLEYLLNLSFSEKMFFTASMEKALEERETFYQLTKE